MKDEPGQATANAPFRTSRRVLWGECDPAGVIYTPHALHYAVELLEDWVINVMGRSWAEMNLQHDTGMPTVRAEIDFVNALRVDQEIVVELHVERIGRASLTTRIAGHDGAEHTYFYVTIVSCLIETAAFKAKEFPADIRARIEAYQVACHDG